MSEIRFSSKEHERFFYQMLAKCGKHDSYYSSFFYCVGISEDTRNHVDRMFDFKERLIKPEALHEGWQTGGSARLTRLAFNLWNGYVEKGEESLSTPYEMFDCGYAPYFYEAIRMKSPEYCQKLLGEIRACLKKAFRNLQAPVCGICYPHSDKISHKLGLAAHEKPFSDTL